MRTKLKLFVITLFGATGFLLFFATTAQAATLDVDAGTDLVADNSACSLSEAIENINDQAQTHDDCTETGTYGTNDTINLPTGVILLNANLPAITESVSIEGQGMDVSVIDGQGSYEVFKDAGPSVETIVLRGFTVEAYDRSAIEVNANSVRELTIEEVEIDGTGTVQTVGNSHGILVTNGLPNDLVSVSIENVYVHDISGTVGGAGGIFSVIIANSGGTDVVTEATIHNLTISDMTNTGQMTALTIGAGYFGDGSGSMNATASNVTIDNVLSSATPAIGLSVGSIVGSVGAPNSSVNVTTNNFTISNISGVDSGFGFSEATMAVTTAAIPVGTTSTASVDATNMILSGADAKCVVLELDDLFGGGSGTSIPTLTSNGGNLTDDNTCSGYFTQPTDQNNISGLASTLGSLSDNGGHVPTMPLLENSLAIDAGVNVAGMSTDARLAARPQGNAFDSGAYESPYSRDLSGDEDEDDELADTGFETLVLTALSALGIVLCTAGAYRISKPTKWNYRS